MTKRSHEKGFKLVLEHFGGVAGLASALGITRQAVHMWKGCIPRSRLFELESLSRGQLRKEDMRPDFTFKQNAA